MKLETYIGSGCHGGSCPTIYRSDRGTFVVQGSVINPSEVNNLSIPANEGVVEIPLALARALADKLANE
jgi:hypothetical protein